MTEPLHRAEKLVAGIAAPGEALLQSKSTAGSMSVIFSADRLASAKYSAVSPQPLASGLVRVSDTLSKVAVTRFVPVLLEAV